jgi:hypothetical protein
MNGRELIKHDISLMLSFLPKGDVPKGLDPTFYRTLTYEGDIELQKSVDSLRKKLELILA